MIAPSQIDIRIEALEVEGLSRSGAFQFQRSIERELARLVSENGLPPGMTAERSIDAISLNWDRSPWAEGVVSAEDLARRIYDGLGQ